MLRTMVVGVGRWGRTLVAQVQGKSSKISFTLGLKRNASENDISFARANGFELLTCSYNEAVYRSDIDAVILASPHSLHAEQIMIAAQAGKHIACEKPFTLNRKDALASIESARKSNVTLAVLHNRRFLPSIQAVHDILKAKRLGVLCHVEANFSTDSNLRNKGSSASWRYKDSETPLGSMTNRGVHILDAMVAFFGPIAKVFANVENIAGGPRQDTTSCILWFKNGTTGYLGTLQATTPYWSLKIYGTEATLEMRGEERLVFHPRGGKATITNFNSTNLELAELEAFADAVSGVAPYPISTEDTLAIPTFLEAAIRSADIGVPIALK